MRHRPNSAEIAEMAEEFAMKFVESTGDIISLGWDVRLAVEDWFKRNETMPESSE